jgi:hypothetical protein
MGSPRRLVPRDINLKFALMLLSLVSMSALQRTAFCGQEDGRGGVRTELRDTTIKVETDGASSAEVLEHLAGALGRRQNWQISRGIHP